MQLRTIRFAILICWFCLGGLSLPQKVWAAKKSWTKGKKTVLYIRVDFPDLPGEPISDAGIVDVFKELNVFFNENSRGQFSVEAVPTPTLRLNDTEAWYADGQEKRIEKDAWALAKQAGFDRLDYDLVIVATKQVGPSMGGAGAHVAQGLWLNGEEAARTTVHELGHNLGLYHATMWKTSDGSVTGPGKVIQYGNPFDVMGDAPHKVDFGPYQYCVHSKLALGWIEPSEVKNVTRSGTYRIAAHDGAVSSPASGLKALCIPRDADTDTWIEFRQRQKNRYLLNGALVYWAPAPGVKGKPELLNMNPEDGSKGDVAPLLLGRTFSDPMSKLNITPIAKVKVGDETYLDLVVNIGDFPDNHAPTLNLQSSQMTATVGQSVTFIADADDADNDTLAFSWKSSDGGLAGNTRELTKVWTAPGTYQIKCIVSDMKGGTVQAEMAVVVR